MTWFLPILFLYSRHTQMKQIRNLQPILHILKINHPIFLKLALLVLLIFTECKKTNIIWFYYWNFVRVGKFWFLFLSIWADVLGIIEIVVWGFVGWLVILGVFVGVCLCFVCAASITPEQPQHPHNILTSSPTHPHQKLHLTNLTLPPSPIPNPNTLNHNPNNPIHKLLQLHNMHFKISHKWVKVM